MATASSRGRADSAAARGASRVRWGILLAFAFSLLGDPVSSVAYAIQAALRALHGDAVLLLPTLAAVIAVVAVVVLNYHLLIGRFPHGAGAAVAAAAAFGDAWAFLPLACLMVDFALTIAISVSAGASAVVAYLPLLAPFRVPLAIGLLLAVAGLTWFGHGGRALFAVMTLGFLGVAVVVVLHGFLDPVALGTPVGRGLSQPAAPIAAIAVYPVAMAWATGVEAPSAAIAHLGDFDDPGRRLAGRLTLWLMLAVVGSLTLALAALAVHLRVGLPAVNSTLVATEARDAVGSGALFAAFQAASAFLLLAAANSGFNAGSGLLKALAAGPGGAPTGLLPASFARNNRHHTPYIGVGVFLAVSLALVVGAGGHAQSLVLFYAVAVLGAFLFGLLSLARQARREGRRGRRVLNLLGVVLVALTLCLDVMRLYPIAPLVAACATAGLLYARWLRLGRPRGVGAAEVDSAP